MKGLICAPFSMTLAVQNPLIGNRWLDKIQYCITLYRLLHVINNVALQRNT